MPAIKPNERIRSAMTLTGYTQEALSKSIGISYSAFSLKLNGKREFTLSECQRIAKKLGTTLNDLFFTEIVPK